MKGVNGSVESKLGQFFLIALGFTWLFWIPDGLGKRGVLPDVIWTNLGFLGAWGPLIAALFMVYKENGIKGIKNLLKKGMDYTFGKKWWAIILLLFPSLIFGAYIISILMDQVIPTSEAEGMYWFLPFIFFAVLFTGGPLQEEFGWRGYALPRLLTKYSPFLSSLILGFVWSIWHLPQFLVPYEKTGMFYITPIWSFILTVMTANFVYTWVFKNTNGSILGALMLHTQMNLFFWIFPVLYTTTGYLWIVGLFSLTAAIILLVDRNYFFSKPQP
ncbi:MAG TPA: type II CAAX endopeptidase family protein [Planococcus sp. (in: firmicutes)]|nr:type II CAAX endopeptidase family protein [Planococcus sp. (in: firmicutes)]